MHTITIRVSGGLIQEIEDIPAGIIVRVVDYDGDDDGDFEHKDEYGERCNIGIYKREEPPTDAPQDDPDFAGFADNH